MKRHIPPIRSTCIALRLLEERDLPTTLRWRNQDHIRKWFIHSDILTVEQHTSWFEDYKTSDSDFVFIIVETCDFDKPVGQISLYRIDWSLKQAEFGRLLIGESEVRHRGMARKATELLVDFGFRQLGLKRIYLEVFKSNTTAISLYQKCGFSLEGDADGLVLMSINSPFDSLK